jgi:hypothetical protein
MTMREAKLCGLHHLKIPVAMSLSVFTRVDAEHRRLIDAAVNRVPGRPRNWSEHTTSTPLRFSGSIWNIRLRRASPGAR